MNLTGLYHVSQVFHATSHQLTYSCMLDENVFNKTAIANSVIGKLKINFIAKLLCFPYLIYNTIKIPTSIDFIVKTKIFYLWLYVFDYIFYIFVILFLLHTDRNIVAYCRFFLLQNHIVYNENRYFHVHAAHHSIPFDNF